MPTMADILLFPTKQVPVAAHQYDAPQFQTEAAVADPGTDAWFEDDTVASGSLETVASLAAVPSQSLAGLATKMEVLVARLAPDDGIDTGLCLAEASLLRSVLRDLRAFVMDAVFAAQGADLWAPVSARADLVQESGTG
jgi:hypothetical protein